MSYLNFKIQITKSEKAKEESYTIVPDKQWIEMDKLPRVKKGSILDFSRYLDAPSGKYGHVKINDAGHFCFTKKPGKRIKFWGTNLCFSANILSKKDAVRMADEIAAAGYNAVRFHHFDNNLVKKGAKVSTELDPEQLNKLDYLFYCLKQRGIYFTIDLYCSRYIKKGEFKAYPEIKGRDIKLLSLFYPPARENWKTYVKQLMNHKNKYTGMTWAEDPALYSVVLVNESCGYDSYGKLKSGSVTGRLLKKYFTEWKKKKSISNANDGVAFNRFITEKHIEEISAYKEFLKSVGYKGLITNSNHRNYMAYGKIRNELDFVDNHNYWDHPVFKPGHKWSYPYLHNQTSLLKYDIWTLRTVFASRIFGKPYTLSELNSSYPNQYRAEFGPIIGAYSSLQDIDGMFRFAWAHRSEAANHQRPITGFDSVQDGLIQLSERIVNLMFLRGDVKCSKTGIAWTMPNDFFEKFNKDQSQVFTEFPLKYQQLGFFTKVGLIEKNKSLPGVIKLPENTGYWVGGNLPQPAKTFLKESKRVSDTGQIIHDTEANSFKVITPKTECLITHKGNIKGKVVAAKDADQFQVITASAMDGRTLGESSEILLFHQSNITNKNIRYNSKNMNAVESWGSIIPLVKRVKAEIELSLPKKDYIVQAVGMDGIPKVEIKSAYNNGKLTFTADTGVYRGTLIYYIKCYR